MKKILISVCIVIILTLLIILGSNFYNERISEIKQNENILKLNKKAMQEEKEDSLSVNVWKNVKFGMTIDEVRKAKTFGDLEGDNRVFTIKPSNPTQLGVFTRELGEILIAFGEESGKFNFLHFKSKKEIYADHIDDMWDDCQKIIGVIEKGFKTNFTWKKNSISISDFNEGERFDILNQSFGYTSITVSMGKKYEGSIYYYEILVDYQNPDAY